MNKQEELNKKLFNRLFLKMPTIRRLKEPIDTAGTIKLEKSIRYLYYSKDNKMWFGHSETTDRFLYFFGLHEGHINKLNYSENSLIIDFDKNNIINNYTLGIINDKDMTISLNKELLEEKYPNYNFTKFNEHIIRYFEKSRKCEIRTLELGELYGDFIVNLEKLLKELPLKKTPKPKKNHNNNFNLNLKSMNLFLNAIKAGKNFQQSLTIAKISSEKVKNWYTQGLRGKSEYVEFYETYKEIMQRNNSNYTKMKKVIDSLKKGKSNEESLRIAESNQKEIEIWYKNGKKGEIEYIDFYEEYKPFKDKMQTEKKNKNKQKNADLIKKYIELINEGKTNKEAFETLEIPRFKTKNWKRQGQLGNKEYQEFYETYLKAVEREKIQKEEKSKKEDQKIIRRYIELINEGKTNKEAFETLEIPRFKTKNWRQQGQLGNKEYQEFYETYLKAIKNEEIQKAKQFIELINEGKTNEQAIRIIRMPDFKIKQWFNSGKNGDEDFIDFYYAYMKQYDTDEELISTIPTCNPKPTAKEEKESEKTCEICGRSINAKSTNTICKRCRRKQRGANILQKLLQSIEPEIPFKKDDLKHLGFEGIQLQDTIWILQENSLIQKEKNKKISLVSRDILDAFIEKWAVELIETGPINVKLTKKCATCGKTLEISKFPVSESSPDGYDENCKDCKKLITTASYLKELLTNFKYDQEFNEDELAKFIPNLLLRQAKTYSLIDNDLLIKNLETNNYKLARKEKCEEFLDKYFKEIIKPKSPPTPHKSTSEPSGTPVISEKEKQMEIVLNARREGKTRKETAKIAGISLYKITHWYKEGRDGFGEDNIYFYNELKKIEDKLLKELKIKFNTTLKVLKNGGTVEEALDKTSASQEELESWIKKGKNGIKPYDSFLKQYAKYVKKSTEYNAKNSMNAREKFLKYIREGKTRKDAAKKASIELKLLDSWIIKGSEGKEPYNEFYKEYRQAREDISEKYDSKEVKIKKEFVELLAKGHTLGDASKQIENGKYAVDIKKWYVAGKRGVNKHLKFYLSCQQAKNKFKDNKNKIFTFISDGFTIKESCEKLNLNPVKIKKDILKGENGEKPFDEFYTKLIESKTSLIDINQLFESKAHPHKNQMIDVLDLMLIGKSESEALKSAKISENTFKYWTNRGKQNFGELYTEFYEIYRQIKSGELINRFKKEIELEINDELDEIEDLNANILAPLPKKIKKDLDALSKETHTGFAWVNKIGNQWVYSKRVNGRNIKIVDINIYELHKKVIKNNLTWGVRDLDKAKEILKTYDSKKYNDPKIENKSKTNPDILRPLSEDIKSKFSKGTSTGFAWVSRSGNYYYYIRGNKNIRIKSSNINDLHKEVISNNLDWGVISLTKARKTLNENSKSKGFEKEEPKIIIHTDILTPLPDDIEKELRKYSKGTSTGFAWVSKIGTKFSYTKVHNNKNISLKDTNIRELHKKVIAKNLPWGVRDLEKAKKTIGVEKLPEEQTINENKYNSQISKSLEIDSEDEIISTDILAPLPKKFEDTFKSVSMNKTGIAWVNKCGNLWTYARQINGKSIKITDEDIYKLHKKVINQKLTWGIRDYNLAKKVFNNKYEDKKIKKNTDKQETGKFQHEDEPISKNILAPLPDIFKKEFNIESADSTGFAWVRKYGSNWYYIRTVNNEQITIKDKDLRTLHEKVINQNLHWGVRNFTKAKETLYGKSKKNKKENVTITNKDEILKIISNRTGGKKYKEMLNELPLKIIKEYKEDFINNQSGFAWVRKIDNLWIYERDIYGSIINLKYDDLFKLYEVVKSNDYEWGVINSIKAKFTLADVLEINEEIFEIETMNKYYKNDILSPISQKLKPFVKTGTGFALVSKNKDYWEYGIYNSNETITSKNILGLYKKVSAKGLLWGVTDTAKAKQILNDEKETTVIVNESGKNVSNEILAPLPKDIEKKLKSLSKGTSTGFAWVIKTGNKYVYKKRINNEIISIEDSNIYELHKKVLQKNLLWGVRNISKARSTLAKNERKTRDNPQNEVINMDILAQLPKEFEKTFKSRNIGQTGFAWVSKVGDNWHYLRRVNGVPVSIKDNDIINLHQKVINQKLTWGVRDLAKAKQTISQRLANDKSTEDTKNILKHIPLEIEYKLRKNSKNNMSGFAWVSKVGDNWHYIRIINGITVNLSDPDIYKLHEIVIKNNYEWGVSDLAKAKQTLKNCNKKLPKPPKIEKIPEKTVQKSFKSETKKEKPTENSSDILSPLPESYETNLKHWIPDKSGFAWVTKIGNLWAYSRKVNGENVFITDSDIYRLHKKVINENLIWGIIDYDKAKETLFNAQPPKMINPKKLKAKKKTNTVFITSNENIISIEGKIKNIDILDVLTRIYEFGDNILKMNTEKNDNETSLSIELELNDAQKIEFKEKIKDFGWEFID